MSGFVLNLLSRSRGSAPVMRPRLASMFEPAEPRASPLERQLPQELDGDEEFSIDDRAARPSPPFVELTPSRPISAVRNAVANAAQGDELAPVAGGVLTRESLASATLSRFRERATPSLIGSDVVHEEPDRMTDRAGANELGAPVIGRLRTQRDDVSLPRRATSVRPSETDAATALVAHDPLKRSGSHRQPSSDHLGAHAIGVSAPTLVPPTTPRFRFEPPAPRTGAAPTIVEINIGRIEVRGVVDRAADRKASTASPVMGLDAYLRAHAKRGGR